MAKRCAGAEQQTSFVHTATLSTSKSPPSECSPSSNFGSDSCARVPSAVRPSAWLRCIAILALLFVASPALAADSSTLPSSTPALTQGSSNSATTPFPTLSSNSNSDVSTSSSSSSSSAQPDNPDELEDGGGIGIVGAFSGISSFSPTTSGSALSLNNTRTSLVALSQSSASLLASASADGPIIAACAFYNQDGSISSAYFGGSFTTLNKTSVGYIAAVNSAGQIDPMGGGVNGPVNALFCNQKSGVVYVGGNFTTVAASLTSSVATMRSNSTGALTLYNSAT
ncbi:hypothetical protein H4S07_005370, partial [Coemansia furcata]